MDAFFVEFRNNDVGPFRTRDDAEAYRQYEDGGAESQVFTSDKRAGVPWIDLARFAPDAILEAEA